MFEFLLGLLETKSKKIWIFEFLLLALRQKAKKIESFEFLLKKSKISDFWESFEFVDAKNQKKGGPKFWFFEFLLQYSKLLGKSFEFLNFCSKFKTFSKNLWIFDPKQNFSKNIKKIWIFASKAKLSKKKQKLLNFWIFAPRFKTFSQKFWIFEFLL